MDADRGVLVTSWDSSAVIAVVLSVSAVLMAVLAASADWWRSGGVSDSSRELLWLLLVLLVMVLVVTGVPVDGSWSDGDGLAKGGDCCLRELGELIVPVRAPGLVVPAS